MAQNIVEDAAGGGRKLFPSGGEQSVEIDGADQGLVVEHLLEVRHQPLRVGGVAVEAAAEMIVDSAARHFFERQLHDSQQRRVVFHPVFAQKQFHGHAWGEFVRAARKAALARIEGSSNLLRRGGNRLAREHRSGICFMQLGKNFRYLGGIVSDGRRFLPP